MQDTFQEIRQQIYEIRNQCAPLELRLTNLEEQMAELRACIARVEATLSADSFNSKTLEREAADLRERVACIEVERQFPRKSAPAIALPAREDKERPRTPPPTSPGA